MRTSYLTLIAAAAMIMAACSNETVLNEIQKSNDKTIIGFSSYSEKATRGVDSPTDLEYYHNTFAVYATKAATINNNPTEIQNVFGEVADATNPVAGTTCTYVDGSANNPLFYNSNWKYTTERYWDTRAIYDFIAYAPAAAPIRFQYSAADARVKADANKFVSNGNVTLYGQNLQDGNKGTDSEIVKGFTSSIEADKKDIDIMISDLVADQDGRDYVRTNPRRDVNLEFHHILSKLNIRIAKAQELDNVTINIKSVEIGGLKHVGTYGITTKDQWAAADREATSQYALTFNIDNANNSNWTELPNYDYTNNSLKYKYFVESIVMPQTLPDVCNLTIKYEIISGSNANNQHTEQFTSTTDISDTDIFTAFAKGYNYTLSLIIQPNVITFDADAAVWATGNITSDIKL